MYQIKKFNKLIAQLARVAHDSQMLHVPCECLETDRFLDNEY